MTMHDTGRYDLFCAVWGVVSLPVLWWLTRPGQPGTKFNTDRTRMRSVRDGAASNLIGHKPKGGCVIAAISAAQRASRRWGGFASCPGRGEYCRGAVCSWVEPQAHSLGDCRSTLPVPAPFAVVSGKVTRQNQPHDPDHVFRNSFKLFFILSLTAWRFKDYE